MLNLNNIITGLAIVLCIVAAISTVVIYNRYNKLLKDRESEQYTRLYNTMAGMEKSLQRLSYELDSLRIQNDSIKLLQYENIKQSKEAKKSADRALSNYRNTHVDLPEF